MAWGDIVVPLIRGLIGDNETVQKYTDERLKQLAVLSAYLVYQDVSFGTDYVINVAGTDISPDPSNDPDFISLTSLRAASMIAEGEYKNDSSKAVVVRDGPASIDLQYRVQAKERIAKLTAANYEKARISYSLGDGSVGRAIVGPFGGMTDSDSII